jgi:PBSX family phage terminase large subunit
MLYSAGSRLRRPLMVSNPSLSPKQISSIVRSKLRKIALWVGAVSAGKTIASMFALFFAIRAARGTGLIVIVGKTLQTIERNIIEPMQRSDLFGELAQQVIHTRGSNTAMILGREVHLVGANDARSEEKIRGATIEIAYVDEATLLPLGFWEMLLTRLRVEGARLLATTNPGASQHWLRIQFMLDAEAKNMIVFNFTMDDNPSLTPEYIRDMKASFTGMFYRRFILGEWTNAEGAIYDGWDPATHVIAWDQMPPMRRILGVGMDFGTQHATSAVMLGLGYDRKLYLIDELRMDIKDTVVSLSPSQQARRIREWLALPHLPENAGLKPEWLIADPAALAHRRELHEGEGLATVAADNAVTFGIGLISSLLARGLMLVSDRCWGVIQEMPGYVWDVKAAEHGEDKPVKENDDSLDAFRYVVSTTETLWRDEIKPQQLSF